MSTSTSTSVRLIDIANRAGVSKMTVARVLHGSGGGKVRVSDKTARRVEAIARELNYQPNALAQKLAGGKSNTIGVIVDSHAPMTVFRTLRHIECEAANRGYRIMIGETHDNPMGVVQSYRDLKRHGVDGVICMAHDYPGAGDEHYQQMADESNLIYLDQPAISSVAFVKVDRAAGIRTAIEFLLQRGRKRIGLQMLDTGSLSSQQRLKGYREALREHMQSRDEYVDYVKRLVNPQDVKHEAVNVVKRFVVAQKLDAILAINDLWAGYLMAAMRSSGIRVPEDTSVIGYDNEEMGDCLLPRLTSIDQNSEAQAAALVAACVTQIEGATLSRADGGMVILPNLIVRDSA
jgi:DNA-binding LacI/PurR family transcriptional regulator